MSPIEIALLALMQGAAWLALGYWLGQRQGLARSAARRPHAAPIRGQVRRHVASPAHRFHTPVDSSERLKRDIETRVQALRQAREAAAPWTPPPVDSVEISRSQTAYAAWFADTAIEPEEARRAN